MADFCLTLLCPEALEEKLLDALLMLPQVEVFTSVAIAAHGMAPERLSPAEQVLGRALGIQAQVLLAAADKDQVLELLRREFAGAGVRYWLTPVAQEGRFA